MVELAALLGSRTRALAARRWLFEARSLPGHLPERIPGVSAAAWARVRALAPLPEWRLADRRQAPDGTTKLALAFQGATVETVLIPGEGRSTVCVSSQAGCTRHCVFCATATLAFSRPLTAGEIVLQYAVARTQAPGHAPARNVVFMGMGEPMDNLDAVLAAVDRLTEEAAPRLSVRHVTVSTSGVLPEMRRFLRDSRAHLALSLNATTDEQRERLMPHNRVWPIAALLDALREDQALHSGTPEVNSGVPTSARSLCDRGSETPEVNSGVPTSARLPCVRGSGRRYFIEYVLWAGVNDTDEDADRLVTLLAGLPAHVNLIPHNPFVGSSLQPPSEARILEFQRRVNDGGVRCLVRWPRGREVAAACGQLALQNTIT